MTSAAVPLSPLMSPATIRARLEAGTPTAIALSTGAAVTVASWLVDSYGTRKGELQFTKTDGSRMRYPVTIRVDSPAGGADATVATAVAGIGDATHADLPAGTWLGADVSGSGAAQVARLRITATANGASWSAIFYPDFLKAA